MASTKYHVFKVGEAGDELVVVKSKRSTAIDAARALRDSDDVSVRVATANGHEVFAQAARKRIAMSPKFTRVVPLPDGIEAPEGARVAYVRPKRGFAVLDLVALGDDDARYALLDLTTGDLLDERFATTRDAGARMTAPAKA